MCASAWESVCSLIACMCDLFQCVVSLPQINHFAKEMKTDDQITI